MTLPAANHKKVEDATRMLLKALGCDLENDNFRGTPFRVAKLYSTVLDGNFCRVDKVTTFHTYTHAGIVLVHRVPFYAFCAHHLLPFFGRFSIGYLPKTDGPSSKVLGLSKLIRLVRHASKVPTTQESFTAEGVDAVKSAIPNEGVILAVEAEHMCMTLRGAKSPGCVTKTLAHVGDFHTDATMRAEFLSQIA